MKVGSKGAKLCWDAGKGKGKWFFSKTKHTHADALGFICFSSLVALLLISFIYFRVGWLQGAAN